MQTPSPGQPSRLPTVKPPYDITKKLQIPEKINKKSKKIKNPEISIPRLPIEKNK
jgi:hypothetical protein